MCELLAALLVVSVCVSLLLSSVLDLTHNCVRVLHTSFGVKVYLHKGVQECCIEFPWIVITFWSPGCFW